jgi:Phage P2 GpE
MADLAQCFHWSLTELKALSLEEIMMWHAEAVVRNTPEKD